MEGDKKSSGECVCVYHWSVREQLESERAAGSGGGWWWVREREALGSGAGRVGWWWMVERECGVGQWWLVVGGVVMVVVIGGDCGGEDDVCMYVCIC